MSIELNPKPEHDRPTPDTLAGIYLEVAADEDLIPRIRWLPVQLTHRPAPPAIDRPTLETLVGVYLQVEAETS